MQGLMAGPCWRLVESQTPLLPPGAHHPTVRGVAPTREPARAPGRRPADPCGELQTHHPRSQSCEVPLICLVVLQQPRARRSQVPGGTPRHPAPLPVAACLDGEPGTSRQTQRNRTDHELAPLSTERVQVPCLGGGGGGGPVNATALAPMLETVCAALILLNVVCAGCCECAPWPGGGAAAKRGRPLACGRLGRRCCRRRPRLSALARASPPCGMSPAPLPAAAAVQAWRCCARWASS